MLSPRHAPSKDSRRMSGLQLQFGLTSPVSTPSPPTSSPEWAPIDLKTPALKEVQMLQSQFRELARVQNAALGSPWPRPISECSVDSGYAGDASRTLVDEEAENLVKDANTDDSVLMVCALDLQKSAREVRPTPLPTTVGDALVQVGGAVKALLAVILIRAVVVENAVKLALSVVAAVVLAVLLH